jgi:replication-associated recombination protein RarA
VADMECLPENLHNRIYYEPSGEGIEQQIRERLEEIKNRKAKYAEKRGLKDQSKNNKTESTS